ncbi:MAG: S-adenosylmethionine (SAM)-dependent methyltransferase [Candidatus Magasanikbacteria bacterium GW2011_GWD2_43_18]|uniref:S-adenosylmethionine (SAM)-dependent methyltransferase n=1 Tax=Candidatus Magasanikbacteria bacterium GW2011_GWE2_42_7 TaxID=1619052 RepID=A0A0G1BGL2_9BACT|nr:MAG: S-adenosylmethionine (SAM)-dependent methyltransferase [Candidatus Magasanikbacteria bacterium GW2011_GWC2_42_27]KKS72555.1 MAG: S-adenosylmethionine (SAM)-dependent methyltransferase [Candidatus Magasanikbacteria bacterium GW2011_GWE2_42_7]KKT05261.1 MAG: S-adenosylmethionine (SAM)-dependent methyltransferase [Candidatus Magasanikbacteria bacterium GW2011_GWD2_43_18]KKT26117.1 MAG: S-adenosylmethionine (SAM)-dependent methyltransferase [Candidatus Magasanikbacteria bacterium GW2011_GWA2
MSTLFYDPTKKSVVFLGHHATEEYWDAHWNEIGIKEVVTSVHDFSYVKKFTDAYLEKSDKILEGGCGRGQYVYALRRWGYDPVGVDYAEQTIAEVKKWYPDLPLVVGDVRSLPFEDNAFKGYWSFGVIEHFFYGYTPIVNEMARVIQDGGYLFVTFPYMSPLRKMKARLKKYEYRHFSEEPDDFYQFALPKQQVIDDLCAKGFVLEKAYPFDAVKGLKDEVAFLRGPLQLLYGSKHIIAKVCRKGLELVLRFCCGHIVLLVFRLEKKKEA